jgi:hypothetical protein
MTKVLSSRAMAGSLDGVGKLVMGTEPTPKILPVLISLPRRQGTTYHRELAEPFEIV